ncbi:MAG: hypothetical protein AABY55_01195 [Candidatus Omnitrophota bacterium]
MKKLIAIIITFIFIFEGAGYCLQDVSYNNKASLRLELSFAREEILPRYLHALVEAGYYTRAGALRRIKASITAHNKAGRFDEAIEFGSKCMEEFPDDRVLRSLVINAYIGRAERALMFGESYKEDYLKVLDLDPQNWTLKRRLVYLGVINKNGDSVPNSNGRVIAGAVNINTGDKYILTRGVFEHILFEHSAKRYKLRDDIATLFPESMDDEAIKEVIIGTAKYGVNLSKYLPWHNNHSLVWYIADNDPELARKRGITRMEIRAENGKIITGFPSIGRGVRMLRRGRAINLSSKNILPWPIDSIWNISSRENARVSIGDDDSGFSAALLNESVFGNLPLIQREISILGALWKGDFVGEAVEGKNGSVVYRKFYKYAIPNGFLQTAHGPVSKIYISVDIGQDSREFVNVIAADPFAQDDNSIYTGSEGPLDKKTAQTEYPVSVLLKSIDKISNGL